VGNVPEEPIEDYPDDQQGGETAQLTSAYPIQKSCSFVTFHFPWFTPIYSPASSQPQLQNPIQNT